jgi:DNA-binding response OmpR family regulator
MAELVARIRVALRHIAQSTGSARGARYEANGLCLDFERPEITVDGLEVHLTPTEYELLKALALHVGKVVTHRDLLRAVWGRRAKTLPITCESALESCGARLGGKERTSRASSSRSQRAQPAGCSRRA